MVKLLPLNESQTSFVLTLDDDPEEMYHLNILIDDFDFRQNERHLDIDLILISNFNHLTHLPLLTEVLSFKVSYY